MTAVAPAPAIKPGVYYNLPASVYHAAPALSNSGLKLLAIDPLEYWHQIINPEREPHSSTPSMELGTALHAAVLEPDTFLDRYNWEVTEKDFDNCLDTVKQIKEWLDGRGVQYKSSEAKPGLKLLAKKSDPAIRILEDEVAKHEAANLSRGITSDRILKKVDWERVNGMARALLREPEMKKLLSGGKREVSIFAEDPVTGVLMKCRMDWWKPVACEDCGGSDKYRSAVPVSCAMCSGSGVISGTIVDPKTFSTQGLPVNVAVRRAIQTYGYVNQAVFYRHMHRVAGFGPARWINAFVNTEAPYHVRLHELGPDGDSGTHKYWEIAEKNMRTLINRYAEYRSTFGDRPWIHAKRIELVGDSDVKVWEEGE